MATVPLNGQLLKHLISQRFPEGIAAFQDAWHARFTDDFGKVRDAPDRATIYRWIKGKWPGSKRDLLRLASLLSIDPFCLLDLNENTSVEIMRTLHRSYQTGIWDPRPLSLLADFLGPKSDWPPKSLSKQYYNRDWCIRELDHDLSHGENFYPTIAIDVASSANDDHPRVFHFAYRHMVLFGVQWVQYGYVLRVEGKIRLVSINGHVESALAESQCAPIHVETWFGPSRTVFRVACLHDFTIGFLTDRRTADVCVRFPA
ncbi:MAG: hypothetical protein AAB227_07965 [Pseudomonadota bacterium]